MRATALRLRLSHTARKTRRSSSVTYQRYPLEISKEIQELTGVRGRSKLPPTEPDGFRKRRQPVRATPRSAPMARDIRPDGDGASGRVPTLAKETGMHTDYGVLSSLRRLIGWIGGGPWRR
ncbi:hypothetical protein GCM10009735_49830 [Actinomadura chokoriensis]